jgi:hypothetical protein
MASMWIRMMNQTRESILEPKEDRRTTSAERVNSIVRERGFRLHIGSG